jgi:hypothetical protein
VVLLILTHKLLHFFKPALQDHDLVPKPQHQIHSLQIQPHILVQVANQFEFADICSTYLPSKSPKVWMAITAPGTASQSFEQDVK